MAAWDRGPFTLLLHAIPVEGLGLINRMLDRAAAQAAEAFVFDPADSPDAEPGPGLDLQLPGVGVRRCAGNSSTWRWYRGSGGGPPPCVSALLAVERFADQLLAAGRPLEQVITLLLRDCHNLAMPGLVAGLLLRHRERAGRLLDGWLGRPEVWSFESTRVSSEGLLHIQRTETPGLVGLQWRKTGFPQICGVLVGQAVQADDRDRLASLAAIGRGLAGAARELTDAADQLSAVDRWVSMLDVGNYRLVRTEHGPALDFQDQPQSPSLSVQAARAQQAMRLLMTYAAPRDRVAAIDTLLPDLAAARDLAAQPAEPSPCDPQAPAAALAAAALVAHAQGRADVPQAELSWAADLVIALAARDAVAVDAAAALDPMGAERSAVVGIAALLLPALHDLVRHHPGLPRAVERCCTHGADEIRVAFALAAAALWAAPCTRSTRRKPCVHATTWTAVQAGLRDCRLGPYNPRTGRREVEPLGGPYETTLPAVPTDRLKPNRLTAPTVAAALAARAGSCIAPDARRLLAVLYATHRRAAGHWDRQGYAAQSDRELPEIVRVLIEDALSGADAQLLSYVREFCGNARALRRLLREAAVLFTYDATLRPRLLEAWRPTMAAALDILEGAPASLTTDRGEALAQLLPTPQLELSDPDPDATLADARVGWIDPDAIADLIERWIPFARHCPDSADALVDLARCAPPAWQASTGLRWMHDLVDGGFSAVANRSYHLSRWLRDVHGSGRLSADAAVQWHRLVDGLTAAGDHAAARLQRSVE